MADTYDIRLPNGELIKGVPVEIEPEQILAQYREDQAKFSESMEDRGFAENVAAAAGRSAVNLGRNVRAAVTGNSYAEEDEAAERRDQALLNAPGGTTGTIAGEAAMFLIPGGAAAKSARLAKALAARPVVTGALAGAGAGLATSTPSTRLEATILGAGGGAAGGVLQKALSKATRGISPDKAAAKQYIDEFGEEFLPIANTVEPGTALHKIYNDILPAMPFGGRALVKQEEDVFNAFRGKMMEKALPKGHRVPIDGGDVPGTMKDIDMLHRSLFDQADEFVVEATTDYTPTLHKLLNADKMVGVPKQTLRLIRKSLKPDADGVIPTKAIMQARTDLIEAARKASGPEKRVLQRNIDKLTDEVLSELPEKVRKDYRAALASSDNFATVAKAAKQNERFSPGSLRSASIQRVSDKVGAGGGGALQHEATVAVEALGKEMGDPGFWRNMAVLGAGGFLAGGPMGSLITILTAGGVSRVLATKTVQNALRGKLGAQKAIQKFITEHPELATIAQAEMSALLGAATARNAENEP